MTRRGGASLRDEDDERPLSKEEMDVMVFEYDMERFMRSCVDRYCNLAGMSKAALKKTDSPFLHEARPPKPDRDDAGKLAKDATAILMKILYGA